ncbi:MAG: head decoration protein [Bradyrhizobium sp.]|uniref:head decoration protein n=1 Tax=Bradyrhizobium sp. TaxID=376 RepID=UPI00272FFF27|nr:head decoration protein [Bradyrhizobium sp.]MDP1866993.1 head decoration protein [Bradyrhizobium sp.]
MKRLLGAALCAAVILGIAALAMPLHAEAFAPAWNSPEFIAMAALAGFSSQGSFTPDGIFAGSDDPQTRKVTLLSGAGVLLRGTVLGKIGVDAGAVTVGAAAFTGTGNGTLTPADPAYGAGVQTGTYTSRLMEAGANSGQFEVRRPDGTVDGYATVGAAYDGQVKFTIADGATDFSGAAQFIQAVTIADTGATKYKKSLAAATDGSQTPCAILGEDCDATSADKDTIAHFGGVYDENALVYGTGHTAATCREALRDVGIKLQSSTVR